MTKGVIIFKDWLFMNNTKTNFLKKFFLILIGRKINVSHSETRAYATSIAITSILALVLVFYCISLNNQLNPEPKYKVYGSQEIIKNHKIIKVIESVYLPVKGGLLKHNACAYAQHGKIMTCGKKGAIFRIDENQDIVIPSKKYKVYGTTN